MLFLARPEWFVKKKNDLRHGFSMLQALQVRVSQRHFEEALTNLQPSVPMEVSWLRSRCVPKWLTAGCPAAQMRRFGKKTCDLSGLSVNEDFAPDTPDHLRIYSAMKSSGASTKTPKAEKMEQRP